MTPGRPTALGAGLAVAAVVLGFLGLRVTQGPESPWRALRLSLGIGLVFAGYLFWGLPWPPRGGELVSALILGGGVLASAAAIGLAPRFPRVTLLLVGVLAADGAVMTVNFVRYLGRAYAGPWEAPVVLSYLLAICVGASWVAALGQLLWTRARVGAISPVRAT